MISVTDACMIAKEYFRTNLGKDSIAKATTNEGSWFFISGDPDREVIGNAVIAVDKQNGEVTLIDLLADEGFDLIRATTPVELPC